MSCRAGLRAAFVTAALVLTSSGVDRAQTPAASAASQTATAAVPPAIQARFDEAFALIKNRRYADAKLLFERVLADPAVAAPGFARAYALAGLGQMCVALNDLPRALAVLNDSVGIYRQIDRPREHGYTLRLLSAARARSGDAAGAKDAARQAVAVAEQSRNGVELAWSQVQLFEVSGDMPLDEVVRLAAPAAENARRAGDRDAEGRLWHLLGDREFHHSLYVAAQSTLTKALEAYTASDNQSGQSGVHNSLGRVYRAHGRYADALRSQKAALALAEASGNQVLVIQSLNAVATVYHLLDDPASARDYLNRAIVLANQDLFAEYRDTLQANLAGVLQFEGKYQEAATVLEGVIARGTDTYVSRRHGQLAEVYASMRRGPEALREAGLALSTCGVNRVDCLQGTMDRAWARSITGDLPGAIADADDIVAQVEALRAELVPTDYFRENFYLGFAGFYGMSVSLYVQNGDARRALETAEAARARAFIDLLASKAGRTDGPLPAVPPMKADDLVATARRLNSTIVSYWVNDDHLFIWVIDPAGSIRVRRVDVLRTVLDRYVRATQPVTDDEAAPSATRSMRLRGGEPVQIAAPRSEAWKALYGLLISPVRGWLPSQPGASITIVPHASLIGVSFAALQSPASRYLLEDFTIHYAPAGGVLQFTASRRRADARTGSVLVVADPALPAPDGSGRPLPRLPGARSEARAIAQLLPASRVSLLSDTAATEAAVRAGASHRAVIHFATHAIVEEEQPYESFLALGRAPGDRAADGSLTADEIYALPLDADLVVLSACRSAAGTLPGDGVATFARAFLTAGSASVVASLWDVADEPTNRLVPDFYRAWLAGASKARALRTAQLRLLADLRAGRVRVDTVAGPVVIPEQPIFWAGFALFGEPD